MKHKTILLTLTFLLGSVIAFAQGTPNVAGTYEGMVKRPGATAEEKVSIELKTDSGKITGRATHGTMSIDVTDAKLENGTLTLNFGKDAMFVGKVDGDKLVGDVVHGTEKVAITLKKTTPPVVIVDTPPAPPTATAGRGAVDLSGQWEAVADANGQPFPFLLTLKIDGESVSGSSSSQLGEAQMKNGTWLSTKQIVIAKGTVAEKPSAIVSARPFWRQRCRRSATRPAMMTPEMPALAMMTK